MDEDLTPRWLVTCLYNGSKSGSGLAVTFTAKTEDPYEAIREGWKAAARKHPGEALCITGLFCTEIPRGR